MIVERLARTRRADAVTVTMHGVGRRYLALRSDTTSGIDPNTTETTKNCNMHVKLILFFLQNYGNSIFYVDFLHYLFSRELFSAVSRPIWTKCGTSMSIISPIRPIFEGPIKLSELRISCSHTHANGIAITPIIS